MFNIKALSKRIFLIKKHFNSNISFLVIAGGAFFSFLNTLLIKNYLPSLFNTYSFYITYLGIISSFGLIGLDQVFLRLSYNKKNRINLQKNIFTLLLVNSIIIPLLISFYFNQNYSNLSYIILLISGISINYIIISYNLSRLESNFIHAQLIKNTYKLFFFITIITFTVFKSIKVEYFLLIFTIFLSISLFYSLIYIKNHLNITVKNNTPFINFLVSFFINILIITFLGYGERLLIANTLGENIFGKYFYYITIFVFPLSLIQQYVGFKELVSFKESFNKNNFYRKLIKLFTLSLILSSLILLVIFLDNGRFLKVDYINDYILIVLLLCLGIVKLIYGIYSAIIGAVGEYRDVYILNFMTILLIGFFVLMNYIIGITIQGIVISLIGIFLIRIFFIQIKYVSNKN